MQDWTRATKKRSNNAAGSKSFANIELRPERTIIQSYNMNKSRLINTSITVLLLVASLLSDKCFADTGKSKVLSMLKVNPIVVAAVTQAKEGSGAKSCAYEITSTELKQYEKGTAYDYDATITCRFKDALYSSMGIVHVTGTYLVSTGKRQALELSIAFAG